MKTPSLLLPSLFLVLGLSTPAFAKEAPRGSGPAMTVARATPRRPGAGKPIQGVVNLNTATAEELKLLPGVGPAKVRQILALRTSQPFRSVDELAKVKGIGDKMLASLRPHVSVSGPTTIRSAKAAAP